MKCSVCGSTTNITGESGRAALCNCVDTQEAKDLLQGTVEQPSQFDNSVTKREDDDQSYSPLSKLFFILAGLTLIGGLILCGILWPGDPGDGYQWKTIAYIPSITWLTVGIVQFALFTAIGKGLFYLEQIVANTARQWNEKRQKEFNASGSISPGQNKKCPFCAETIKNEAIKCRYCGKKLDPINTETTRDQDTKDQDKDDNFENRILCSDIECAGVLDEDGKCKVCGKPGKELHQTSTHDLIKGDQLLSKDSSSVPPKGNSISKRVCRKCDEIIIIRDGVSCPKCGDINP